jgi:hypothetical protein
MKVSIYNQDPNIEGIIPVELSLIDGSTKFMLSEREDGDVVFDSWEVYANWLNDNIERPKLI